MSFDEARKDDRQVVSEAQAIVMKVLGCNPTEASEVIRKRAETEQRSVIDTARAIADGGVANFH
jgi:AmiR/NasT family two-component response regulator